jgi:hypothetical protein
MAFCLQTAKQEFSTVGGFWNRTSLPRTKVLFWSDYIVTCSGWARDLHTGFGLDYWIYCTLFTQLGTRGNTALSLIYTLYDSQLHKHYDSQSSLVVSWQRIYNRLTVTSNHIWSFLAQSNSFHAIILQLPTQFSSSAPKLIPWQAGVSKLRLLSSLNGLNWTLLYSRFARTTQKTITLLLGRRVYSAVA